MAKAITLEHKINLRIPLALRKEYDILGKKLKPSNYDETIKRISNLIHNRYTNKRTITVIFSNTKKYFTRFTNDYKFISRILPDKKITLEVKAENEKRQRKKQNKKINEELIRKLLSYNKSNNIYKLTAFIQLVTGRRMADILQYKMHNIKGTKEIQIDSVAKRRDGATNLFFPCMVSKTTFFKAYKKFWKMYDEKYTSRDLPWTTYRGTYKYKSTFQKHVDSSITSHDLRKIYAGYMYKFRNKKNIRINYYVQDILLQQTINASTYYTENSFTFKKDIAKGYK